MFTKLRLPGLKILWTTTSPFVLLRPVGTKGEMAKRLPQLTGLLTRVLLTGECLVKWTCPLGGLERVVALHHFHR